MNQIKMVQSGKQSIPLEVMDEVTVRAHEEFADVKKAVLEGLIQEFKEIEAGQKLPEDTDAVMILSVTDREENRARTELALGLIEQSFQDPDARPLLIFNGTQAQVDHMKEMALRHGFKPADYIELVIPEEVASTKTQFSYFPAALHGPPPRFIKKSEKLKEQEEAAND